MRLRQLILVLVLLVAGGCQGGEQSAAPAATAAPAAAVAPGDTEADVRQAPATTLPPTTMPEVADAEAVGNADVLFVEARETGTDTYTFSVTVAHPDTGWEDYADGWDVVLPDGTVVKPNPEDAFTRVLLHPHENEQPFTRSQSNIVIPPAATTVTVRAHDLVDGFGGRQVVVDLTSPSGPDFEVVRP